MLDRRARSVVWLCAALALAPATARAQSGPPPASAPAPIPLPALVTEAESAERFAQRVAEQTAPAQTDPEIERGLAQMAPDLAARVRRVDALVAPPGASLDALNAEAKDWGARAEQLTLWQRAATARLEALGAQIDQLEARAEVWRRTRDAAAAARAPADALARIESVRVSLQLAHERARDAQRRWLDLQARVAEQQSLAQGAQDRVDAARASAETSLLEADSPPLWRAFGEEHGGWPRARERVRGDLGLVGEYLGRPVMRFAAHALAFALVTWLCFRGRRFAQRARGDPQLAASTVVFERPFASAALVALALTPFFHPHAPGGLLAFARIALAVPLLRLLPALAPRSLHGAIVAAALLALVGEARGALAAAPGVERALFALELGAAAATIAWLMRPARLVLLRDVGRLHPLLPRALRAALLALFVAFAADALGWSNLAHLLGAGTLRAVYAALAVYGGARVLRAGLRAASLGEDASRLRLFRDHAETVQAAGARVVNFAGFAVWAALAIMGFGLWPTFMRALRAAWTAHLTVGSLAVSLGDVCSFALTLWAASLLARLARFALEGDVLARWDTRRGVAHAVARTAQYVVLLLGFFAAAAAAGIDMNKFAVLAGAFGVGIGFGLQNVVNNFVSGLILLYERPIQVGDAIEVDGIAGDVTRIGVRSSTLRTGEGAEVIVPNATIIAERVTNWTLSDRTRRVELRVGAAYGSDPRRVCEVLLRCAREHPAVLAMPDPVALLVEFGESALAFELRFWTHFDAAVPTRGAVAIAIVDAFAAAGIEMPFPQRDLHLRSVAPNTP